ncbi:MAG TPA: Uma2 family endonuclease [Anaerolineae bacterium]|nr:Uma2 family endonuclease [Anaerolineae bacterium]
MQQQQRRYVTPQEYIENERRSEFRSEYLAGEIYAMSGATRKHNVIVRNISRRLDPQRDGQACELYTNDMRVEVSTTGLYTYPDVVIVCGQPRFKDANEDTLLNPTVLIEVLSSSTASYDRGEKFEHYGALPSLTDYLLVSQDRAAIEQRVRTEHEWQLTFHYGLEAVVPLPAVGCELRLADVYEGILFADPKAARGSFRVIRETGEEYDIEHPGGPTY